MSRLIKFRVWCTHHGEWEKDSTALLSSGELIDLKGVMMRQGEKHHIVEQYTGLKDKNGVEIYEGSILSNGMCNPKISVVEWEEYGARFICKEKVNGCMVHWAKNFNSMYVIGSIHQNPELLESKQCKH